MDSFINMPSCCRYAWFVMHCSVVSASSSQRGLHIIISAMLCFLLSLKPDNELVMFTCLPSYLLVLFGLCSVRDFCHLHLVEHNHDFFCYGKFLYHVDFVLWTLLLDAVFCMSSNFTKSVILLSFALLPCLFELDMLWTSHSSLFIFCQTSPVDYCHVLCCYVGVL